VSAPVQGERTEHPPGNREQSAVRADLLDAIERFSGPVVLLDVEGAPLALNREAAALFPDATRDGLPRELTELAAQVPEERRGELLVLTAQTLDAALRDPGEHAESRRQLNQAQAVARIGSWTADRTSMRVRFSDEQYRLYGLPLGSEVDLDSFLRLVHADEREAMRSAVVRASRTGEPFRLEHRLADQSGPVRWIEARCEVVMSGGRVLRMVGTSHDITERKRYERSLEDSLAEVRASRIRIVAAADEERRRVERDLHDGAQQRLVAMTMGLRLARRKLGEHADPDLATLLDDLASELQLALSELRDLARGIHPAMLTEQGLASALEGLVMRCPVPAKLIACPDTRLPAPVETGVYYVVAEALTNTLKHARASRVTVAVHARPASVVVEVCDDGQGGAGIGAGSGLRGLSDRVASLDGRLSLHSPAGAGTTVTAELPCV
jgi:PAS domain S-box-containing protein